MTFRLGYVYSLLHEACAAVVVRVFEAHGIEVSRSVGMMEDMAPMLVSDELDMVVSAWLPECDGAYINQPQIEILGDLYAGGLQIYAAASQDGIKNIEDIRDHIYVPQAYKPWAEKIMNAYGLAEKNVKATVFDEHTISNITLFSEMKQAAVLLPQPSFLHHHIGPVLNESQNILPHNQKASLLLRGGARDYYDSDIFDELDGMLLGHKILVAMEEAILKQNMNADEAAEAWQRGKLIAR